ncbi:MAG: transposase zinc-binding domain-containing protein [Deltaproteobacteria bacterium]|nr:transposase zinc-binding domain-containing protein [Deltaproteobacteria bacterium]
MPRFVARALEAYLRCGILEHGFLRARCDRCSQEVFVAFSCKGRTCPSCGARRMEEGTEHLMAEVAPDVPVRQWVLSLPFELRPLIAYDRALFSRVTRIFAREVFRTIRAGVAKTEGVEASALGVGAIVALQRFGSTLNLNPHVHLVALDGAYVVGERAATEEAPSEPLRFVSRTPPSGSRCRRVSRQVYSACSSDAACSIQVTRAPRPPHPMAQRWPWRPIVQAPRSRATRAVGSRSCTAPRGGVPIEQPR